MQPAIKQLFAFFLMCTIIKQSNMRRYFVAVIFEIDKLAIMPFGMLYVGRKYGNNRIRSYFVESLGI